MLDLEILGHMLRESTLIPIETEYDKHFVTLNEPQSPDSYAIIRGIPSNAIVIKVDSFESPDKIFKGANGECKRADYVIVANDGNKKRIIYIELKRTKNSWNEIVKQLTGSLCFIRYCQEIGKTFWKETNFLKDYQQRFVSIGHTGIPKRKTRIEKLKGRHDSPEKAMKIAWPRYLQYNQIAGGE